MHYHLAQFFIRCVTSLSHLLTISYLYPICVGVIDGISVCASWGLRVTDRMISVVAGPDDTGSIAPPSSARSCLRCNWTGSVLRARSTNPSPRPGISAEQLITTTVRKPFSTIPHIRERRQGRTSPSAARS
ncbi:hypothetical protein EI94DRAFT_599294 [Lactarius quietus]|nr:hypothetical protein EI94DRAFT_599294 [Lactarius quietus]